MTHMDAVTALPYNELPPRWQRPVRWLLERIAAWADEVEQHNVRGTSLYWECERATWEQARLQKMLDIMSSVRIYAETAKHIRSGGKRLKPQRLRRILHIMKDELSESPFAGRFADQQGIGAEHDAVICGKHRRKVYSRSHKLCGCYVWLERDAGMSNHWFWHAYHERRGASGTGHTPLEAVRSCLRLWRYWWRWDDRARRGQILEKELQKMNGWRLRKSLELRGCHARGRKRADLVAEYRQPQASLFSLYPRG